MWFDFEQEDTGLPYLSPHGPIRARACLTELFLLSPQMSCVQIWRFNLIGLSPAAPVMVLKRFQVCANCCFPNSNMQHHNTCQPQGQVFISESISYIFQKHLLHAKSLFSHTVSLSFHENIKWSGLIHDQEAAGSSLNILVKTKHSSFSKSSLKVGQFRASPHGSALFTSMVDLLVDTWTYFSI